MAFVHGRNTKILINDVDLSSNFSNLDLSREVDTPETTAYGDIDRTFVTGLIGGSLSIGGMWDGATDRVDEEVSTVFGNSTNRIFTGSTDTLTIGQPTYMASAIYTSYSISSPVDGVVGVTVDVNASNGIDRAVSLHNLSAETTTGNGTSVNNLASSAFGGRGHLHVTAAAGSTPTLDVLIEDSANDTTFATFITFAQATARTSERVTATGTVDQYTRISWTISGGSPSFTFHVSFARRNY